MKNKICCLLLMLPFVASCGGANANMNLLHAPIENKTVQTLSNGVVGRTAYKAIKDLSPYFTSYGKDENYVLSPSSYLLAVAGFASAGDGFDNSKFGLETNAASDTDKLLKAWNFEYDDKEDGNYCYFRSAILHQQVGEKYAFDREKREELNKNHISTMVSDFETYRSDAKSFFKDKIGLSLEIPDAQLEGDSVLTYGGIKMKDYVANGLGKENKPFVTSSNNNITTPAYSFGSQKVGKRVDYYKGENYQAFKVDIHYTDLLIVLPDENVAISSVDVAEAYQNYLNNKGSRAAYGYVPFFHAKTEAEFITEALTNKLTGNETLYSKLLEDDVTNDLAVASVIQSSDFEFNEYGVSGESITMIVSDSAPAPDETTPIELNVNRPFYAISLKDDFPIFASMVLDPSA